MRNKNKTIKIGKIIKIKSENRATKSYPLSNSKMIESTIFKELSNPDRFISTNGKKIEISKNTIAVIEKER